MFLALKDKKTPILAKGMWQDGKPKKWYYAIPIVLIWILKIALILKEII